MRQSQLIAPVPVIPKPSDRCCDQSPYFRACLEASAGPQQILASTDVCARHLGDTVQDLTMWAQRTGLHGQLTVLAIGAPGPCRQASRPGRPGRQMPSSFAFSIIPITPLSGESPPGCRHVPVVRPAPSAYDPCPAAYPDGVTYGNAVVA